MSYFKSGINAVSNLDIIGEGPIFGLVAGSPSKTRTLSKILLDAQLDVRPIVYPTVPRGSERLRISLHSFNTEKEIDDLLKIIKENS